MINSFRTKGVYMISDKRVHIYTKQKKGGEGTCEHTKLNLITKMKRKYNIFLRELA